MRQVQAGDRKREGRARGSKEGDRGTQDANTGRGTDQVLAEIEYRYDARGASKIGKSCQETWKEAQKVQGLGPYPVCSIIIIGLTTAITNL